MNLSKSFKILLLLAGILTYTYSFWFFPNTFYVHFVIINDWAIAIGSSLFIISSLGSRSISKVLLMQPIQFTGKISYSLYLFHTTVIFSMMNLLYDKLPMVIILCTSFVLSIIVATFGYYAIEQPSIKLGKLLTFGKMNKHNNHKLTVKKYI